jgi:hypothetical protein
MIVPFSAVCLVGTNSTTWSVTESSQPTSRFQRSLVSGAMGSSLRCSPKTDAARLVTALESASADDTPLPVPDMSSPSSSLANFSFIRSNSERKSRAIQARIASSSDHQIKLDAAQKKSQNWKAHLRAARRGRAGTAPPRPPRGRWAAAACRRRRRHCQRTRAFRWCCCRSCGGSAPCGGCRSCAIRSCQGCGRAGGSAPSPSPPPRAWRARRGRAGPGGLAPPRRLRRRHPCSSQLAPRAGRPQERALALRPALLPSPHSTSSGPTADRSPGDGCGSGGGSSGKGNSSYRRARRERGEDMSRTTAGGM